MSIGHGSHNCSFCKNYAHNDNRRCCLKYDFVLPTIGFDYLCKEYESVFNDAGLDLPEKLDVKTLYYYYYDNQYEILDTFDNLQQLVLGIWIKKIDKRYEIIKNNNSSDIINIDYFIEIQDYDNCYFPDAGFEVILKAGDLSLSATVYNVYYRPNNDKYIKHPILVSSPSNSVYDWLSVHFDMSYIVRKINEDQFLHLDTGFPAFLKIDKLQSRFILMPVYLYFKLLFGLVSICDEKYLFNGAG